MSKIAGFLTIPANRPKSPLLSVQGTGHGRLPWRAWKAPSSTYIVRRKPRMGQGDSVRWGTQSSVVCRGVARREPLDPVSFGTHGGPSSFERPIIRRGLVRQNRSGQLHRSGHPVVRVFYALAVGADTDGKICAMGNGPRLSDLVRFLGATVTNRRRGGDRGSEEDA